MSIHTLQPLVETTFSPSLNVDRSGGMIRQVKILGRRSRNGRVYTDAAMREAAALYEGADVNIDHPAMDHPAADRKLAEGFGVLVHVRQRDDGVYGDLQYLKSHPLAEMVLERAERMPTKFGLSHNAEGRVSSRDGEVIVESIERVLSVDLVRSPATNAGLFESQRSSSFPNSKQEKTPMTKTATKTIRDVFFAAGEKNERHRQSLAPLLEMIDGEQLPNAPLEAPQDAGDQQQLKTAFKQAAVTLMESEPLETAAMLSRLREVLQAQGEVMAGEKPKSEPSNQPASQNAAEPLEQLMQRVERMEARETARCLLEERGLSVMDIGGERWELLLEQDGREAMETLLESWPASVTAPAAHRPVVTTLREQDWRVQPQDYKAFAAAVR